MIFDFDNTQMRLVEYLNITEEIFRDAIKQFDGNAEVEITP